MRTRYYNNYTDDDVLEQKRRLTFNLSTYMTYMGTLHIPTPVHFISTVCNIFVFPLARPSPSACITYSLSLFLALFNRLIPKKKKITVRALRDRVALYALRTNCTRVRVYNALYRIIIIIGFDGCFACFLIS